jgi:serine/threonine-protein kinase
MADALKKFGKYFLLDLLAQGGMADIYRARHATPSGGGRLLAIKRIQQSYSANPEFINMFRGETKVTSSFTHPNIIQVYDYGEEQGQLYIAMEYVDGRNLRQCITRLSEMKQLFPTEVSCYVIEQSCRALEYAHQFKDKFSGKSLNIIHRDVSPQNIIVSYDGAVKVIDFGIAKTEVQSESTRAGVIKGKPSYLSPEQITGEVLDGRSDVFALGTVFWELLTGRKLFAGDNDLAVIRMIENCQNHIKPASQFNPKVPKELDAIIFKSLEKDRTKRYQSASEMQRALHKFLAQFAPEFNPEDLSTYARELFNKELLEDRKRLMKINEKAEELIKLGEAEASDPNIAAPADTAPVEHTDVGVKRATPAAPAAKAPVRPAAPKVPVDLGELPELDMGDVAPDVPAAAAEPAAPARPAAAKPGLKPKAAVVTLNAEEQQSAANIKLEMVDPGTGSIRSVPNRNKATMEIATASGVSTQRPPRPQGAARTQAGLQRPPAAESSSGTMVKAAVFVLAFGAGAYYWLEMRSAPQPNRSTAAVTKPVPAEPVATAPVGAPTTAPAGQPVAGGEEPSTGSTNFGSSSIALRLKITPAGGHPVIKINGAATAPSSGLTVPVPLDKAVTLTVEREGFETYTKSLMFESARLAGMRDLPMDVELIPSHYGFLSVYTTPSAEAIILIEGGEERIQTPFSGKRLPVGRYKIRLENKLLGMSKELDTVIEENRVKKVEERLSVISDTH